VERKQREHGLLLGSAEPNRSTVASLRHYRAETSDPHPRSKAARAESPSYEGLGFPDTAIPSPSKGG
jgi:hypothetical protein